MMNIQEALFPLCQRCSLCARFSLGYKSCAELFTAGFTKDGVYQILSDQSEMIDVYCDQSGRGGGTTLIELQFWS